MAYGSTHTTVFNGVKASADSVTTATGGNDAAQSMGDYRVLAGENTYETSGDISTIIADASADDINFCGIQDDPITPIIPYIHFDKQ